MKILFFCVKSHPLWGFNFCLVFTFTIFMFLFSTLCYAQNYQVNGNAVSVGGGLVKMTSSVAAVPQSSSAWSTTKIDLTQAFDMTFDMFFGCDIAAFGGDGMTFTFQNAGINALGQGQGYLGVGGAGAITPSISIEFDTYNGTPDGGSNEIVPDHIAIDRNGNVNNTNAFFIGSDGASKTVQAIDAGRDLEDCAQSTNAFYYIRIVWNPTAHTLQLYENGILTMTYTEDIVTTIFGGNSSVYWGFTAATGSAVNEQWIAPHGQIIPWECVSGSCCATFTPTTTGPTTICSAPITVGLSTAYLDYDWSTGATTSTTSISAPGTYTVNVLQNQAGVHCPGKATVTITSSGATSVMSGNATICNDGTSTSPISIALTGTSPWTLSYAIDGVTQIPPITGITSSPYTIAGKSQHTYTVASLTDNSGCIGARSGSAVISAINGLPIGHDSTFTNPGSTVLKVDNGGDTYEWYTAASGGIPIYTGPSYTTPVLNATTTYYVKNASLTAFSSKTVGLPGPGTGGSGTNPDDLWLTFTANSTFTFTSVTCAVNVILPWSNTYLSVTIDDLTNASLSRTIDVLYTVAPPAGLQNLSVPLNFAIISGHQYKMSYRGKLASNLLIQGSLEGMIFWNYATGANAYPITKDSEVTISRAAPQTEAYPALFNWIISVGSTASSCARTPVTAYPIIPLPVTFINFTATLVDHGLVLLKWSTGMEKNNSHFVVQRSNDGINFTDIKIVAGAGNSVHILNYQAYDEIAGNGIYYYRIKQVDFDGRSESTNIQSVKVSETGFLCNIFPNPSKIETEIHISIIGALSKEVIPYYVFDVSGRVLYKDKIHCDDNGTSFLIIPYFLANTTPGTYVISLNPNNETPFNQKLVIME